MKLDLTDSEWIQLLDGQSDDSELQACCANISALRDVFVEIVRNGRNSSLMNWTADDLKQKIKWVADGHDLTPVLQKVCAQINFDPSSAKHTPGPH